MRALVTGGAGFIGSTLVDRLLAEDWRVDVVDDLSTGSLGNLERRPLAARPAVLVPPPRRVVARGRRPDRAPPARRDLPPRRAGRRARVGVAPGVRRDRQHPRFAERARRRRRTPASRRSCSRVPAARSTARPKRSRRAKSAPQRPESPYGVAKKAVGDYLHYYREVRGLEYTALALANVYGPRQDPNGEAGVVAIFAGKLLNHERPVDLRRRRTDARLRVRRRRRRRVRARHREGRRAAAERRHRRRDERAAAVRHDGAHHRVQGPGALRAAAAGRVAALRARPGPRRDPPRLEAVDVARRGPRPHPRALQGAPQRCAAVPLFAS